MRKREPRARPKSPRARQPLEEGSTRSLRRPQRRDPRASAPTTALPTPQRPRPPLRRLRRSPSPSPSAAPVIWPAGPSARCNARRIGFARSRAKTTNAAAARASAWPTPTPGSPALNACVRPTNERPSEASRLRALGQRSLNGAGQRVGRVWLGEPGQALRHGALHALVQGVSAGHDRALLGEQRSNALEDLEAVVLLVQRHVEDHQIEGARSARLGFREQLVGRAAAALGFDFITHMSEDSLTGPQLDRIVVDDQHARAAAPRRLWKLRDQRLLARAREVQREGRALSRRARDVDEAFVLLDDTVHDREPEAGTAAIAGALGAEERLEDPSELLGGDPGAVVGDRDGCVVAGLDLLVAGHRLSELDDRCLDAHASVAAYGIDRVVHEVADGARDLGLGSADHQLVRTQLELQLHAGAVCAALALELAVDAARDDLVQAERILAGVALASEREQVLDGLRGAER